MRVPVVVGLDRRVGTTTVAAGLHAQDAGHLDPGPRDSAQRDPGPRDPAQRDPAPRDPAPRDPGRRAATADIVVCGSDAAALARAGSLVLDPAGPRPVLAVAGYTVRARLHALDARFGSVVVMPQVLRWHDLGHPLDDVGALLGQPPDHLPLPLRAYASALRAITTAVLASGQLEHPAAPAMSRPSPVELCRGPYPVVRAAVRPARTSPPRPAPVARQGSPRMGTSGMGTSRVVPAPDLDDDALEALLFTGSALVAVPDPTASHASTGSWG